MPPDLALLSTLIGSNYPCLELIFMVPKVFEPLKFDCKWFDFKFLMLTVNSFGPVLRRLVLNGKLLIYPILSFVPPSIC